MKPLKFMKIMEAAKVHEDHEAAQVQVEPMPLSTPKKECQACRKLTPKKVTFDMSCCHGVTRRNVMCRWLMYGQVVDVWCLMSN
jgi:hypothetical protein